MPLHGIKVGNEDTLWDIINEQCAQLCHCHETYPESNPETREMYVEVCLLLAHSILDFHLKDERDFPTGKGDSFSIVVLREEPNVT